MTRNTSPTNGFQGDEAVGDRVQPHDVPVPGAGDRHETEVKPAPAVEDRMGIQANQPDC
jgi:hypothetical protein